MLTTFIWIARVLFGLVCILHILSLSLKGLASKIISYVNLGLHLLLLYSMLLAQASLDKVVLTFMFSLLVYLTTFSILFVYKRKHSAKDISEVEEEEKL